MIGCCNNSGVKYRNSDQSFDISFLEKRLKSPVKLISVDNKVQIKTVVKVDEMNLSNDQLNDLLAGKSLPETVEVCYDLCTCPCHTKGLMIDH